MPQCHVIQTGAKAGECGAVVRVALQGVAGVRRPASGIYSSSRTARGITFRASNKYFRGYLKDR